MKKNPIFLKIFFRFNSKISNSGKIQTTELARHGPASARGALKEESFCIFQHPLLPNFKILNSEKNWWKKFSEKSLTMPKKTERGTIWNFSTSILSQNIKKLKGALWGNSFEKKSHSAEKKPERGLFSLSRYSMLRRKRENPFGSVR